MSEQEAVPVDGRSSALQDRSLDLFSLPGTDISYNGYRMVTVQPTTDGTTPMEFIIPALDSYVDLNRSYFTIELQLLDASDGGGLAASDNVYVLSNLAHNLFKQFNMRLNGTLVSPQTDTYPYKAFFEILLNNDRDDGETILRPQGWFNGLNHFPQLTDKHISTDGGWGVLPAAYKADVEQHIKHTKPFLNKKKVKLIFKPYHEMFHTGKVLPSRVEIKMRLYFHHPEFFTWSVGGAAGTQVKPLTRDEVKIRFHLCQLSLNSSVFNRLKSERALSRKWVTYPTVRSEIRTFNIGSGVQQWNENNLFQGRIPNRMIVGLLDTEAFNGHAGFHPFVFRKFGLEWIKQISRGEEYPYETLEIEDPPTGGDRLGYFRFLQASGAWSKHQACMVRPDEWGMPENTNEEGTCTLFMWDNVANGKADSATLHPKQAGDLQLHIKFNANLPKAITALVYGEFEDILNINPDGSVIYNIYNL